MRHFGIVRRPFYDYFRAFVSILGGKGNIVLKYELKLELSCLKLMLLNEFLKGFIEKSHFEQTEKKLTSELSKNKHVLQIP
jgi:hypothetical protein